MPPKKWPDEMTKEFIRFYKQQPILYKSDNPKYHNKVLRARALDSIKTEMQALFFVDIAPGEIKKKINNLRTQFIEVNKTVRRVSSDSTAEDYHPPSWWLYDDLLFLAPYLQKEKNLNAPQEQPNVKGDGNGLCFNEEACSYDVSTDVEGDHVMKLEVEDYEDTPPQLSEVKLSEMSTYFSPLSRSRSFVDASQNTDGTSQDFPLPSSIQHLCNFIGHELAEIKDKRKFNKCKWDIIDLIRKYQDLSDSD